MFPLNKVQYFELNSKGNPRSKMHVPNHKYFVEAGTGKKIPVDFEGLLVKDSTLALKQSYLMQILQIEKDIQRAKYIYHNWDWIDFLMYQQSLISVRILET